MNIDKFAVVDLETTGLDRGQDSIVELGLVYDVRFEGTHVEVDMTLTSPGCPVAPEIMAAAHRAALTAEGVESVHINLVWSPRWDPRKHASEDALMDMGLF